jgi:hypothetical protein
MRRSLALLCSKAVNLQTSNPFGKGPRQLEMIALYLHMNHFK